MSKLSKQLYTDITRLKLLDTDNANPRFQVLETPFNGNEHGESASSTSTELVIIGQIFPNSDIYKERSYKIEIKLTKTFPVKPPEVRFLTPIYHLNVDTDGIISNDLLHSNRLWTSTTSLVKVVEAVTDTIDNPNIDYALRAEVAREYQENREEFKRNALQNVQKYGLPRS